jgi:WD40-like Beta Propeller Repeat
MSARHLTVRVLASMFALVGMLALMSAPAVAAAPEAPGPVTAESFTASTAHVRGMLDPNATGEEGTYEFLYDASKTSCVGGEKAPASPGLYLGLQGEEVAEGLSGLLAHTEYSICLLARNLKGETSVGPRATFTTALPPEVPTAQAPSPLGSTSATLRGQLNPGAAGEVGSYEFLYKASASECTGGKLTSTTASIGHKEEAVSASIGELSPATQYTFCVLARNGAGETALSAPTTFTTHASAPNVEEESAADISASGATLNATLNPGGADTTYRFELAVAGGSYEPLRGLEAGEVVVGAEGDAGNGIVPVPLSAHVQGLSPNTSYSFRLVASSSVEAVDGRGQSFITQSVAGFALPDGRQWEMVSQPQKLGALIEPITEDGLIQASVSGEAISYEADTPTESEPAGYSNQAQVLSTRGPNGWTSVDLGSKHDIATGASVGYGQEYRTFSSDLSLGVAQPLGSFTPLSDEASEQTSYLHTNFATDNVDAPCTSACYRPLVSGCPPVGQACAPSIEEHADVEPGTVFENGCGKVVVCGPVFAGATPDLSHIVLESSPALTPGATAGGLYEWFNGKLSYIAGGYAQFAGISEDGKVVFYTYFGATALYAYDSAAGANGESIYLGSGRLLASSSDGSKAFFGNDECEVTLTAGKLSCKITELDTGGTVGLLGASKDGSWLYFTSNSILTNAPNSTGEHAVAGTCESVGTGVTPSGECNVYVLHHGDSGWEAPKLVSLISALDLKNWDTELGHHTARVSPNGQFLAFMTQANPTGYNNHDAVTGQPDEEVYLYNANSSILACASCNPTGARPVGILYEILEDGLVAGDRVWEYNVGIAANIPGWTPYTSGKSLHQSRYLSDSGRLFFNSSEALVPQDVNGNEDVYEYEPPGTGDCNTASVTFSSRSGGCVDLISSGTSGQESGFLDASESGADVFFLTFAKLSSKDTDTAPDVYDARECTATTPCYPVPAPTPPPCVTGDACKAAPTPQPASFGAPASATFSGAGNVSPSTSGAPVKPKPKPLTRAQKLTRSLKACRMEKSHKKRAACERQARKRYAAKAAGKTNAKKRGK